MRTFIINRGLLLLGLVACSGFLAAEETGKVTETMPTTDVAGLKTLIRAEIIGGDWELQNEGELTLLFVNPSVSNRDKVMLKRNPFSDNKDVIYRFRVALARGVDSTSVTLGKELAYTDDDGVPRFRARKDEESLNEVRGILDRVKEQAAAFAPHPPASTPTRPADYPLKPMPPLRPVPSPAADNCHDVTRCVDITEIAKNAGANCERGNISISNGCGIDLLCRVCAAGQGGRLDCKNVPLSAKSGDKAGQVYAWCDLTGKPFANCTLPNDPASCRSF